MVKAASWSDVVVGVCAASAGAAAANKKATAESRAAVANKEEAAESRASAANKKVAAEVMAAEAEAGAARANMKSMKAEARANKKANKAAAAAEAAAEEPYHFPVPSEDYFDLWEDPKDREEIRAAFTRIAELFSQ